LQRKGFGALLSGVFHIPYPNSYRCTYGNPSPCNCVESATILEREIFKRIVDPEEVAQFLSSRSREKAGTCPRLRNFSWSSANLPQAWNLLVSDEVQSGMAGPGSGGRVIHAGIEPDILCVAKGIASGCRFRR